MSGTNALMGFLFIVYTWYVYFNYPETTVVNAVVFVLPAFVLLYVCKRISG